MLKFSNLSGISIGSALHYSAKNELKIDTKRYNEGNYEFTNKKVNYKNFEKTSVKKIKKFIQKWKPCMMWLL